MTEARPATHPIRAPGRGRGGDGSPPGGHQLRLQMRRALIYAVLTLGTFYMALPFYWMATSSLKSAREAQTFPPTWIPSIEYPDDWKQLGTFRKMGITVGQIFSARYWTEQLHWDNYPRAWLLQTSEGTAPAESNFTRYFFNSVLVAVVATGGALLTSILAAYALATMNFIGAGVYFFLIIGTLYIPGQILLIPNYIFFDLLGREVSPLLGRNTYFVLIIPWIASVASIFLLRQSFMTLPRDLFDAARMDGASRLRYLFLVVLPLSKPTLITVAILNFLGTWNSLLWPLVMAPEPKFRTIMVGLGLFRTEAGDSYDLLMAASTFSVLPIPAILHRRHRADGTEMTLTR
jgi:multiple sugar transport system permease protein